MIQILTSAVATLLGVGYLALALADHAAAVDLMPAAIAITLLALGAEAITRRRPRQ